MGPRVDCFQYFDLLSFAYIFQVSGMMSGWGGGGGVLSIIKVLKGVPMCNE